ncbi:MAG: Exodeoxyribonuclease 7 large subunit [Lentisphaerae bacterium ADurb.BinA184]|nr:MAG: Exodeoxyribonuclease 7 large subunit [Lentisphaerae bacterium ADurb.BinA184]
MPQETKIWSVSELNRLVKDVFEQSFYPFWVRGEVSNLTLHRSGHVYLTLKDERSQLSAVYFRGVETARRSGLAEGMLIEVCGRLTVYEPRGAYQLVVTQLRLKGKGDLQQRFEELKLRLQAEGLFDPERKRPVPALPRRIGVVTSPQGAALQDFLNILGRRFANVQVRIVPAAVQGERAAAEVAEGVRFLNRTGAADVIVVTRGGGSLEDLWPFNDETLARVIAASQIPVISAVGHEVDFTICDFVADLRVPTPSAAAELVIGRQADLFEGIANLRSRLRSRLLLSLGELRRRVERAAGSYVFREPGNAVRTAQQRVDEASIRLQRAAARGHEQRRAALDRLQAQLTALDPRRVLGRGYSILLDESGVALTDATRTAAGARLRALLARGELGLTVNDVREPRGPA